MRQPNDERIRRLISQESAKIIAEEGVRDYKIAKQKAATRLNVANKSLLPSNVEIEQALLAYQRLFKTEAQSTRLNNLRQIALEAMEFFKSFKPRLVGPVLTGAISAISEIQLHLFADTAEEIMLFLMENDIPFASSERRFRINDTEYAFFPVLGFEADETSIDLTVFPHHCIHEAPRSPIDGRPMRRAKLNELKILLNQEE